MLKNRLVRQSAVNISSSTESTLSMSSPPPVRRRRNSEMFRQVSSESLDQLLKPTSPAMMSSSRSYEDRGGGGGRRHSVACGVLYVDKPSIKSAFNSAVRRMSDACSLLSSAPSSTYNLSAPQPPPQPKKENEVILPSVLRTYRPPPPQGSSFQRSNFQSNRRFSTDCPPPSYSEATSGWKQHAPHPKQKLTLMRQNDVVATSKSSLVALEDDDDVGVREQN